MLPQSAISPDQLKGTEAFPRGRKDVRYMPPSPPLPRQVAVLTELYSLTDRLYRAGCLDTALEAVRDAVLALTACGKACAVALDPDNRTASRISTGLSPRFCSAVEAFLAGQPEVQPVFIFDIASASLPEELVKAAAAERVSSLMVVPLFDDGKCCGFVIGANELPYQFAAEERTVALTIAHQAAHAVAIARREALRLRAMRKLQESEERFRQISEDAPVMIWMSDDTGACLHLNRMLRRFWNIGSHELHDFDWRTTMLPADVPLVTGAMYEALVKRQSVSVAGRYRNADGQYRVLLTEGRPRFAADGSFLGMIGVNIDITERETAERALRESEERFRIVVEALPSGLIMADTGGEIMLANRRAEELFGYGGGELLGRSIETLVPPDRRQAHASIRAEFMEGHKTLSGEFRGFRRDGSEFPAEIGVRPIDTAEGLRLITTIVDVSERKRAETQRELLLAELNHRVKNTLAVVQGLSYQTFRNTEPQARKAFEGRLLALSAAHDLLTRSNWENASLHQVAADTLRAAGLDRRRVSFRGPAVRLSPKAALSMALALHELFTNTVKYGALSNDAGQVDLEWKAVDAPAGRLAITWRESGGPPVTPPKRRGFGSRLLEQMLTHDLDGAVSLSFAPEGLVCALSLPLGTTGEPACLG